MCLKRTSVQIQRVSILTLIFKSYIIFLSLLKKSVRTPKVKSKEEVVFAHYVVDTT